jgi:hypothetical protein
VYDSTPERANGSCLDTCLGSRLRLFDATKNDRTGRARQVRRAIRLGIKKAKALAAQAEAEQIARDMEELERTLAAEKENNVPKEDGDKLPESGGLFSLC